MLHRIKTLPVTVALLALASLPAACDGEREPYEPTDTAAAEETVGDVVTGPDSVLTDSMPEDSVSPEVITPVDIGIDADIIAPPDSSEPECPDDIPGLDDPCVAGSQCSYGQECCCGECFASKVCECHEDGFACYATDACYVGGWCGQPPCCSPDGADFCADWQPGSECKIDDGEYGKCLMPVKTPSCWVDGDCPAGETCEGAAWCPCNADCDMEDTPGTCTASELPTGCCYEDGDCDLGTDAIYVCGWNEMSGQWGRCMWLPEAGQCWDDSDCGDGKVCQGAAYCPCDAPCGMADMPGECVDAVGGDIGDPCGQDGGECKSGLVCCYPCGIPDCQFECTEPCDPNEPWCEGGCPLYA